jgi:CPA1 family monovalent cation:H+ antiporter
MIEKLETLLILLGILGILAVIAERVRFPFPILLVISGLVIGCIPGLPEVRLRPETVLFVILPPLLFSAAWNFPWEDFRANLIPIFGLAVGLVLATMVCVAFAATWLIPGMTLAAGCVLGAIVSPPDAVSATAVLKNVRVPRRLSTILEGESLVHDSSGLVAYHFAVAAVVTGAFSFVRASGDFVWTATGGILYGWLVGIAAEHIHRQLREPAVQITLTILTPYLAYLPAEKMGISGVLAVVAAGLHVGHRSWVALTPESRLQREAIWKFIDYFLNGLVFIVIGLQFPSIIRQLEGQSVWKLALVGAGISLVVILVRFAWIFPLAKVQRMLMKRYGDESPTLSRNALIVASWAGMRGVVSMAAALALPTLIANGEAFPQRHIIIFVTFCVIFVTLVFQGLTLPFLARWLKVEEADTDYRGEADARILLLEEIVNEIGRIAVHATDSRQKDSLEIWRVHYQDRIDSMRQRMQLPVDENRAVMQEELNVFPRLMDHARRHLKQMRRDGKISEEVRKRIEYDFDLEQQRIQRILGRLA